MKISIIYSFLTVFLLFSCCDKKDNEKPTSEICYYKEFNPNISLEEYSIYNIDIDNDNTADITFYSNPAEFGISVNSYLNEIEISKGIEPFSGSYHVITLNDTIGKHLDWLQSLPLSGMVDNVFYGEQVDFLGFRKRADDSYYYGWLGVESSDSSFKLKKAYFLKSFDVPVLAGVINDTCKLE